MIHQIKLPADDEFYKYYIAADITPYYITPLSQINFFIGPNNSGKSRMLRQLIMNLSEYEYYNPTEITDPQRIKRNKVGIMRYSYKEIIQSISNYIQLLEEHIRAEHNHKQLNSAFNRSEDIYLDENDLLDYYDSLSAIFSDVYKNDFSKLELQSDNNEKKRHDYIYKIFAKILQEVLQLLPKNQENKFTYIPSFRTLRKFLSEVPNLEKEKKLRYSDSEYKTYALNDYPFFKTRVQFDYFLKESGINGSLVYNDEWYSPTLNPIHIFTGETLFDDIKSLRNSGERDRKILTDFEYFLSSNFFNSKPISINALNINNIKDVYIKIGFEKELPIYHLGDGIQAIILLTFPLFVRANQQHQIFYEEPELFMHPGMQKIFIEVLKSFTNTQAYIATHSNHFLDTSLDFPESISIFSVRKNLFNEITKFEIENLSSPQVSILNELGVRNSSVLLANCSIWVEGVSDRIYLKKYLKIYMLENPDNHENPKQFKEDLHYSFFEYGGNNIIHYDFVDENQPLKINALRLSNRIFLLHDRDQGKQKRHDHLKKQLQDNYYQLDVLEIENLLTPEVLKETLTDFKTNNADNIVFKPFSHDDYKNIPLGVFVKTHATSGLKKIFTPGSNKITPRLYNKVNFAQKAIGHITSWEYVSPEAQQLTKLIYKFIESNHKIV